MSVQSFKNQKLTRVKVRNNILKVWSQTTENDRFDWYGNAHGYAVKLAGLKSIANDQNIAKACGIIAALSPMCSWDINRRLAKQFILVQDPEKMPCLKANARKAYKILHSDGSDAAILDILKGPKTSAFFLNIMYPDQAISLTMDRHAISIAVGYKLAKDKMQMTAGQYEFFQETYRWTAAQLGVNPLILQSATWVAWRAAK